MRSPARSKLIQQMIGLASRHHHSTVLGYLDIVNFKAVNDSFGHLEGDRVLKTVSDILGRCVRATDVRRGRLADRLQYRSCSVSLCSGHD